ncbi:MAG: YlxR family protein [Actinomycetota bacterium]|nr:YlxR family protein [Actinomycetota bacterium]
MASERTCVGCRRRAPQSELLRLVRTPGGSLAVGRALPGRGAWICVGSPTCLERAGRRGALERALRSQLAPGAVDALVRRIGGADDVGGWKNTPAAQREA